MSTVLQLRSREVARVEEVWQQFVPSASLRSVDPERFRFEWKSVRMPDSSLLKYELAAQVHAAVKPEDQLLVCRVEATDVSAETSRGRFDARQPWLTDGTHVDVRWAHTARVRAIVFDRAAAQQMARRITGDDTLRLRTMSTVPDRRALGAHWDRTFAYLEASLEELTPGDALTLAGLERLALWTTLTTFRTTFSEAMERPSQRRAAPATVRKAMDFIDENAHRPITIDDIAAAAHISTRGLQYAFRRALDTTPTEYLRRARLDGAHRELLGGSAEPIAVIARRWGFTHPSRFAAAYRRTYGLLPAETPGRRR